MSVCLSHHQSAENETCTCLGLITPSFMALKIWTLLQTFETYILHCFRTSLHLWRLGERGMPCAMTVWQSEDSCRKSSLSLSHVGPGAQARSSILRQCFHLLSHCSSPSVLNFKNMFKPFTLTRQRAKESKFPKWPVLKLSIERFFLPGLKRQLYLF
jgi:hypothetical protein